MLMLKQTERNRVFLIARRFQLSHSHSTWHRVPLPTLAFLLSLTPDFSPLRERDRDKERSSDQQQNQICALIRSRSTAL
ncbi:hypothetical protein CMV_005359 [Castanea mollissima]|uniref:Uncharacterized protein n=1 Tax=Castanea mollissima TaxID=60419 RepID=A0A8J4RSV7_9ROSI|nr:hypothetical protein CMV_005359 [Castanea mollissima]